MEALRSKGSKGSSTASFNYEETELREVQWYVQGHPTNWQPQNQGPGCGSFSSLCPWVRIKIHSLDKDLPGTSWNDAPSTSKVSSPSKSPWFTEFTERAFCGYSSTSAYHTMQWMLTQLFMCFFNENFLVSLQSSQGALSRITLDTAALSSFWLTNNAVKNSTESR